MRRALHWVPVLLVFFHCTRFWERLGSFSPIPTPPSFVMSGRTVQNFDRTSCDFKLPPLYLLDVQTGYAIVYLKLSYFFRISFRFDSILLTGPPPPPILSCLQQAKRLHSDVILIMLHRSVSQSVLGFTFQTKQSVIIVQLCRGLR